MFEASSDFGNRERTHTARPCILCVFLIFFILVIRLFYLQVLKYNHFLYKSNYTRIKREVIEAPRGIIFDRNGTILAENQIGYAITFDPIDKDSLDVCMPRLASLIPNLPALLTVPEGKGLSDYINERIRHASNPEKILREVDFRLLSTIEEHSGELPGIGRVFDQRRNYPYAYTTAHIVGYMGELTQGEYKKYRSKGYGHGQSIGRFGIEQHYEKILKGNNGSRFVERNYKSRILGLTSDYRSLPPEPGTNMTLTLDIRLQCAAAEAFGDSLTGSLVALDPQTGEILVMYSSPSFNPNEFTHFMTQARYDSLQNNPGKPLFNRAIQATYPPGSTFKMLTALAGLEHGYDEHSRFQRCTGSYYYGRWYDCWKEGGHGSLDMVNAIINSCNVYFFQLGQRLTLEEWSVIGDELGFGKLTAIDLSGEEQGNLPCRDYYRASGNSFSPGIMLNLAIGQGENLVTVLQLAHYTGIIATEGVVATPHLVKSDTKPTRKITTISPESFAVVKKAMLGVVNDPNGTAKSVRVPGHLIAGKTGTAQNPHGPSHKLFVAFAPFENPTIVFACVVESVGDYSYSLAVALTKKILSEYFIMYPEKAGMNNAETLF